MMTTSFPRFEGDTAGIFIKDLAESISKFEKVKVITSNYKNTKKNELINENLQIKRFNYFPFVQNVVYPSGMQLQLKKISAKLIFPFFLINYSIKTFFESMDCDIIHANWFLSLCCALPAKFILGKKIVLNERGGIFHADFEKKFLMNTLVQIFIKYADAIVLISAELKQDFIKLGIDEKKIFIIHNGIRMDLFKEDKKIREKTRKEFGLKKDYVFVSVSNLIPRKKIDILINAFDKFSKKVKNTKLIIVGDGQEKELLKKLAKEKNISERVLFLGQKPRTEVAKILNASDCFVLTSLSETGPNTILEAMAVNLPVITTRVGITHEIISKENGEFIEKNSVNDLERKMHTLYLKKESKFQNSNKLKDLKFGWENTAKNYINVYRTLTQKK